MFDGAVDPMVAEEWISMMEKIFDFVRIEDIDKVNYVVYMLRKDARIWWDVVKKTRDLATITWAEFLIEFNFKYYCQLLLTTK